MKISLAQINPIIGDINGNENLIIEFVEKVKDNSDIVVFPEMSLCGYPPRDLLLRKSFISRIKDSIKRICDFSEKLDTAILIGAPWQEEDKLYNAAVFIYQGKILFIQYKNLLPQYDVFDEHHYFYSGKSTDVIEFKGKKIGILICEDSWVGKEKIYSVDPVQEIMKKSPDILINIAASPYYMDKIDIRYNMFKKLAVKNNVSYVYVNQTGANDDLVFDGSSMVLSKDGEILLQMESFIQQICTIDLEKTEKNEYLHIDEMENVFFALVTGIKDYFRKCGLKKAILGISGGVDSALVAYLAVCALGKDNVTGVAMPSKYSTEHSLKDAEDLARNIGIKLNVIEIKEIYENYIKVLNPYFDGKPFDVTEENIQARIRGNYLMAFSNKHGHMVLTTGNKSEVSVGYCTMYGDMCGGLNPIGDLYKTTVYDLCRWINREEEIIPENIIIKEPSAELRDDQKDSDSLPSYDILDNILKLHIENNLESSEIVEKGFDKELVDRIIWLFTINEHKRKQYAPILKVSPRAFGQGYRMPIAKRI